LAFPLRPLLRHPLCLLTPRPLFALLLLENAAPLLLLPRKSRLGLALFAAADGRLLAGRLRTLLGLALQLALALQNLRGRWGQGGRRRRGGAIITRGSIRVWLRARN